jgi:hypothetical protein
VPGHISLGFLGLQRDQRSKKLLRLLHFQTSR